MAYHPFRHLGLKFIAVAVALGLWFTVAGEETVERNLAVPLELQNRSEQLELVGTMPTTVHVRVRGRAGIVSQLDPGRRPGDARSHERQGRPSLLRPLTQVRCGCRSASKSSRSLRRASRCGSRSR